MKSWSKIRQRHHGVSFFGFLLLLVVLAVAALVAAKVVPTVVEYSAIRKALNAAKNSAQSVQGIQAAFDKQAAGGYIESVSGKDLDIVKGAEGYDVSVAYEKKIGLFGPVSLLIDYVASTSDTTDGPARKAE